MKYHQFYLFQENFRMKQFMAVVLLIGLFTSLAAAQSTLTLDKAVEIAVGRNTTVVQARNTLEGRRSAVLAAYGNLLPSVSLSGDWAQSRSKMTFINGVQLPGTGTVETQKSYSAGIGAGITLFDGLSNISAIDRANAQESASVNDVHQAEKYAIYQTNYLFLNTFKMYQLLQVNEDNLKRSKEQLNRIVESNKVGSVALADVYRQRVQVGSDELALIQAQNNFDKAKADLYMYLAINDPENYPIDFTGTPTDIDIVQFEAKSEQYKNLDNLLAQAIQNRSDYLSALRDKQAAEAGVVSARSGYWPNLSASASYGYSNNDLSHLTDNSTLRVGLSLSYPLFNGFQRESGIEQAQVTVKNADEVLQQTRLQIKVDIQKALLDYEAWKKQIVVTKTSVESAEMDRKIAEEKYNLGAGTLLDVLTAQANFTTVMNNKVSAVVGYMLSLKSLEYTIGTISQ